MADWDDDDDDIDDGDLEEFDPAKSAIESTYNNNIDTTCKRKFIELHLTRYPDNSIDTQKFYHTYQFTGEHSRLQSYVKTLIRYYYDSNIPFEDELEAVDRNNFPTNKEIKRFITKNTWSYDYITIDRYSGTQPTGADKEKKLEELLAALKIMNSLAFKYYPQLENLPARGFRELERNLYTINYLMMVDLYEAKDRLLGLNKAFYEEIARKRKELSEKKEEAQRKENNGETWLEKWQKMTDEEKDENERINEENERLEKVEYKMRKRFYESMSDTYINYYKELNIPKEAFLAKVHQKCWLTFRDAFYMLHEVMEHYKISDEPLETEKVNYRLDNEEYVYNIYKKMKENGGDGLQNFLNSISEDDRGYIEMEDGIEEMTKTALKVAYEFFPKIVDLPPSGIMDIKYKMEIIGETTFGEMDEVYDRLFNTNPEFYEKWDKEAEEYRRNKYFEGEL